MPSEMKEVLFCFNAKTLTNKKHVLVYVSRNKGLEKENDGQ